MPTGSPDTRVLLTSSHDRGDSGAAKACRAPGGSQGVPRECAPPAPAPHLDAKSSGGDGSACPAGLHARSPDFIYRSTALHITPASCSHTHACAKMYIIPVWAEKPLSRPVTFTSPGPCNDLHPFASAICNTIKNFVAKERETVDHLRSFSYLVLI